MSKSLQEVSFELAKIVADLDEKLQVLTGERKAFCIIIESDEGTVNMSNIPPDASLGLILGHLRNNKTTVIEHEFARGALN